MVTAKNGLSSINFKQTPTRYKELKKQLNMALDKTGIFPPFTVEQYNKVYQKMVELGLIKEGDKICKQGIKATIQAEFDPQIAYYYEIIEENRGCSLDESDHNAMREIISIFGKKTARKIERLSNKYTIDEIIKELKASHN